MGTRLRDGLGKVQVVHGSVYVLVPKIIAEFNHIKKGTIIKWDMERGWPHISKIINDEHEIVLLKDNGVENNGRTNK